jgi:uncharacterized protein YlxW (UPF0749 family)
MKKKFNNILIVVLSIVSLVFIIFSSQQRFEIKMHKEAIEKNMKSCSSYIDSAESKIKILNDSIDNLNHELKKNTDIKSNL